MNLYLKETGQNNPETIIFLHGVGLAGWMWDEQVKEFSDYHCLVPDLPEHGNSQEVGQFTIEVAAEMIVDIIKNRAHNGKSHLVGLSLGAQVIVQILSIAPEVVSSAFISGTLVHTTQPSETFINLLNNLIKIYLPVKNDKLSIGSYIRSYNLPKNLIQKFKESTCVIQSESAERIIRENTLFQMPDGLENVDVPVLVMVGEKDYIIIKKSAKELIFTFPNSKGASALKVGHMWNMENPELFNKMLESFLNTRFKNKK